MPEKKYHRIIRLIVLAIALGMLSTGCSNLTPGQNSDSQAVDISGGTTKQSAFPSAPVQKSYGGKFRIAYVDIDEYPVTGSMLYYVIESLKQEGWITYDSLPMDPDNVDAKALVNWLAARDLGPYLEFVSSANYYLAYEGEEAVAASLLHHVRQLKDIDLVFAMGTWPGRFVKSLNLDVPVMVYGSIDPVGSGIVASAEDSGSDNLWAQVDSSAFARQLQFYYDTINFKNIGMVYNDEYVASIPDYEKTAAANGFTITKVKIEKLQSDDKKDIDAYYNNLRKIYRKLIDENKVDAYLINTDIITDDSRMKDLFQMFTDAKIPVFVQIGDNYVQNGAFMLVSPRDYKGLGAFVAFSMGAVLNGASPRDLPQECVSSPYLSLNLDVAKSLSYTPTFEMLMSCENIYSSSIQKK